MRKILRGGEVSYKITHLMWEDHKTWCFPNRIPSHWRNYRVSNVVADVDCYMCQYAFEKATEAKLWEYIPEGNYRPRDRFMSYIGDQDLKV